MEYKVPNTTQLRLEYLKKYGEEFLSLNNLNVGDIIEIDFKHDFIRSKGRNSREMEKFTAEKKAKGVLKIKNGILIAESLEDMVFYVNKSNGRSGRDYKSWYETEMRKSVIIFGQTFIF